MHPDWASVRAQEARLALVELQAALPGRDDAQLRRQVVGLLGRAHVQAGHVGVLQPALAGPRQAQRTAPVCSMICDCVGCPGLGRARPSAAACASAGCRRDLQQGDQAQLHHLAKQVYIGAGTSSAVLYAYTMHSRARAKYQGMQVE